MGAARPKCPTCSKAVEAEGGYRPFCSERCKMVDLGRWFQGEYVVAGEDAIALDPEEFEEHLRQLEEAKAAEGADDAHEGGDAESDA